ncbi:MAG TPA: LysR family transcriptional regulator [Chthoniobacterales bacterium]|nr:LysR family transcriptional regulator [Chthoniobacterales bacterium]
MNIHHLELFYYVAKHRGISAASRHMPYGIQQPAISGQMTQLESTLGVQLFHRRPFSLTPPGTRLYSEIEPFFRRLRDLPAQVRGHSEQRLRLAAPVPILRDYLPEILAQYKRRYPEFRLNLHNVNQGSAEELLRQHEIDLAITELEGRPAPSIRCCELVRLPLVLVVPKRSALRTLNDAFRNGQPIERLISLPSNEVITRHFQNGLTKRRLTWQPAIQVSSIELVHTYTKLGFGVGMSVAVPRSKGDRALRQIPLPGFPQLTIAALWTGDLGEIAASFLEDVKKIAARLTK